VATTRAAATRGCDRASLDAAGHHGVAAMRLEAQSLTGVHAAQQQRRRQRQTTRKLTTNVDSGLRVCRPWASAPKKRSPSWYVIATGVCSETQTRGDTATAGNAAHKAAVVPRRRSRSMQAPERARTFRLDWKLFTT
jgi:hypothetical protein